MDALFGFLRRKTDFYVLPEKGKEIFNRGFDKHLQVFQEIKQKEEYKKAQE